ncbi:MAG: cupin-like domain-containing protein, partial [Gammaproteobacteria bacterium]|nr:cupin-like domain-containing protein [Gammaproteobacteria bacterium]
VVRSLVKLLDVDFDQYPRFHHCLDLAQVVTLEPGDTLYIPPLWWHHVESYGFNVMVNAWYADVPESAQKPLVDATALFRNSLSKLSRFDDADLDALHAELYSIGRSGTRFEHRTGEKSHKRDMPMRLKAQSGRLQEIFASIADLPPFWQDHIERLYEYYVFRRNGDPYPTLPGMLDEVARKFRPGLIGKVSRRTFALRKRLFPGQ